MPIHLRAPTQSKPLLFGVCALRFPEHQPLALESVEVCAFRSSNFSFQHTVQAPNGKGFLPHGKTQHSTIPMNTPLPWTVLLGTSQSKKLRSEPKERVQSWQFRVSLRSVGNLACRQASWLQLLLEIWS